MLVPSKRKKRQEKAHRSTNKTVTRRPGRPMKRLDQLMPTRTVRKASSHKVYEQQSALMNMAAAGNLSLLERLPVEIIEHIFFDALETNLANASLTLNQVLSRPAIYQSLILFAFFDDDGRHPVEIQHFRPARFRRISMEDRLLLQLGILKCKWCTLQRIMTCMPALSRLAMVQAWHQEWRFEQKKYRDLIGALDRAPRDIVRVPHEELLDIAVLPDIKDEHAMQDHFSAKQALTYYHHFGGTNSMVGPASPDGFLPFIQCWDYSLSVRHNQDGLVHKTVGYANATLGSMVIPDKLLEGNPWTSEKVTFLQLLRQGLRYKRNSDFIIIKFSAMVKGMESAINESDVHVLRLLIELHERVASLYQDGPALDKNYERVLIDESDSNSSLDALPKTLFHLATRQGPASSELLSLLIRVSWRSIHPDDPTLTRWALRAAARGDRIAKWLMKFMEGAYGKDFRQRPVFINGAVSWRLREEDYPFPESSFTQEAGYIHDHAPDVVMRRWPG